MENASSKRKTESLVQEDEKETTKTDPKSEEPAQKKPKLDLNLNQYQICSLGIPGEKQEYVKRVLENEKIRFFGIHFHKQI
jgi:hypothetical protein